MENIMRQIIRKLRKECGFTQEELAEQLGVTFQAVSKWENRTGMPDISQVVPLASVLGVSTDMLFGGERTSSTEEVKMLLDTQCDFAIKKYANGRKHTKYKWT